MDKEKEELFDEIDDSRQNDSKKAFIIIVIFIIALIIAVLSIFGYKWYRDYKANSTYEDITDYVHITEYPPEVTGKELIDNPVEFGKLQAINDEIYAWIYVPNTRVNYPVAQSRVDDEFYLHRDYNKNYLFAGTIFSESCNKLDFSDPVTVLYGHNMYESEGTMFTTLHFFENSEFFNDNEYFYIYMPGHILKYRIVSAFKYDNRHIMNSFDFSEDKVVKEFFDTVSNPDSLLKNVREEAKLKEGDKLLILSTCVSGDKSSRFLVNGVLIEDERTK